MKIVRDGKEFELTDPELAEACMEYAHLCHCDDVESSLLEWCDENGVARERIDEDTLNEIIDEYEERLWWHEEDNRESIAANTIERFLDPDDYMEE